MIYMLIMSIRKTLANKPLTGGLHVNYEHHVILANKTFDQDY